MKLKSGLTDTYAIQSASIVQLLELEMCTDRKFSARPSPQFPGHFAARPGPARSLQQRSRLQSNSDCSILAGLYKLSAGSDCKVVKWQ